MFRDESSHVIKKAKAKPRNKTSSPCLDSASSPDESWSTASATPEPRGKGLSLATTPNTHDTAETTPPLLVANDNSVLPSPDAISWPSTPTYNLAPSCQEQGTAYFFSRYVTIDEYACHQRFDFIYDVWKPASWMPEKQLDGVMASMTAVGLVGLANLTRSREAMDSARKSYGTALRLTNTALENAKEAVKDTTMLSILILGLFEMMTDPSLKSMKAWHKHVNGAAALAKMRGTAQFRTKSGVRMFTMLCQNVIITCIQKELPMPPALVSLRNELAGALEKPEPGIEISMPIYKVLQARYDIRTGGMSDPDVMLDRLNEIESEFERVISFFPDTWQYKVFRLAKPHKSVYKDTYHLYPSIWTTTVWNGLRGVRILILESILGEIHKRFHSADPESIPPRYLSEVLMARSKLERIMTAILASVPQQFGLVSPLNDHLDTLMPISTIELCEPPTQSTESPEPTSVAWPGPSADERMAPEEEEEEEEEKGADHGGPTLTDPMRARDPEEEAERFMLLASATHTIVWPLYFVGMSSLCSPSIKAYVVERFMAIFNETGLSQAKTVAGILRCREITSPPFQWIQGPLRPNRESLDDRPRTVLPV